MKGVAALTEGAVTLPLSLCDDAVVRPDLRVLLGEGRKVVLSDEICGRMVHSLKVQRLGHKGTVFPGKG